MLRHGYIFLALPPRVHAELEKMLTRFGIGGEQFIREAVMHYCKKVKGECEGCTFSEDPGRCPCFDVISEKKSG